MKTVALVGFSSAVSAFVGGLLGVALTIGAGSTGRAIIARGVCAFLAVLIVTVPLSARAKHRGLHRPVRVVLIGALAGYLLDPFSWDGRTGISQLVFTAGRLTMLGDLLLWLLVAALGAWWGARRTAAPDALPTLYG